MLAWLMDWAVVILLPAIGVILSLAILLVERRMKGSKDSRNRGQAE